MARKPTAKQQIRKLLDDLEPTVQKAFFDSIDNLKSNIELNRIVARLEQQDIDGALRLLNIDASAYRPLQKATDEVFESGGNQAVNRRRNGTPYRLPKGTPASSCIGSARVGPGLSI